MIFSTCKYMYLCALLRVTRKGPNKLKAQINLFALLCFSEYLVALAKSIAHHVFHVFYVLRCILYPP